MPGPFEQFDFNALEPELIPKWGNTNCIIPKAMNTDSNDSKKAGLRLSVAHDERCVDPQRHPTKRGGKRDGQRSHRRPGDALALDRKARLAGYAD